MIYALFSTLTDDENNEDGGEEQEEVSGDENENVTKTKRYRKRKRRDDGGDGGDGGEDGEEDDGELARIPYEILAKTAATAVRLGLSHGQHLSITAAFLQCAGVDIDKFPLSHSTSIRRRKEVVSETYEQDREAFRQEVEAGECFLFVHPDTKELADSIGPHGAGVTNRR